MVQKAEYMKWGDLHGDQGGVQAKAKEPAVQESECSYER